MDDRVIITVVVMVRVRFSLTIPNTVQGADGCVRYINIHNI